MTKRPNAGRYKLCQVATFVAMFVMGFRRINLAVIFLKTLIDRSSLELEICHLNNGKAQREERRTFGPSDFGGILIENSDEVAEGDCQSYA